MTILLLLAKFAYANLALKFTVATLWNSRVVIYLLSSWSVVINSIIYIFFNIVFTTSLSLLKLTGTGTSLSISNSSTLLFKLLKLVGTFFNLSISNWSASDFKLIKSTYFYQILIYQHLFHFINLLLLHCLFLRKNSVLENIHSSILCLFYLSKRIIESIKQIIVSFPFNI